MNLSQDKDYPEIKSLNHPAEKLIVFLHGVGSDGHDLINLVPLMQSDLPNYHFISPHGIEAFDMAPYGRQWFSLQSMEPKIILPLIEQNAAKINDIITSKQQELNLTNQDTILIGFSQGTIMALYINLTQTSPFAGVVGFSGRLVVPHKCTNIITPICLIHGALDEVIMIDKLDEAAHELTKLGIKCYKHELRNLSHSIDHRGINIAINFIKNMSLKNE